jgi:hypothetical protein
LLHWKNSAQSWFRRIEAFFGLVAESQMEEPRFASPSRGRESGVGVTPGGVGGTGGVGASGGFGAGISVR